MGKSLRKALVCLTVAAAMAFSVVLTGCSASNQAYEPKEATPSVSTPTIGQEGVLRVGVNTNKSPLAGMTSSKIVGIDVDVAAAIADALGLKLSIVDVGSDPETALAEGSVDIVLGIDKNSSDASFWKSNSYLPTGVALFAMSSKAAVPSASTGAKFAAQVSSTSAWAVVNEFGESSLTSTTNLKEAFSALSSGSVQYVAADAVVGMYYANGSDIEAHVVALMQQASGYCVGVLDTNTELKTIISDTISQITGNGVMGVIEQKWLGESVDLSNVSLTTGATSGKTASSSDGSATTSADGTVNAGSNAVLATDVANQNASGTDSAGSGSGNGSSSESDSDSNGASGGGSGSGSSDDDLSDSTSAGDEGDIAESDIPVE